MANTLLNFANNDVNRVTIREEGWIEFLVKMLSSNYPSEIEVALRALHNLAQNDDNKEVIVDEDGISPLLDILSSTTITLMQKYMQLQLFGI